MRIELAMTLGFVLVVGSGCRCGSEPAPPQVVAEQVRPPHPRPDPATPHLPPEGLRIEQLEPTRFRVSGADDGSQPGINDHVRIVPAFKDGIVVGFKLFGIRPGSVYEQAGLEDGDIVTAVGGRPLTTPEEALEAYSRLRTAPEVRVDLLRDGRPLTFTYVIEANLKPRQPRPDGG